ncbi:MAG TPA: RHS repeat-associated core domain-containing protein [Kiritimatiellia bacterium]|nr:RHS repeat-associated core domain-containing protein [Kiritimatiellia bacterium]
MGEAMELWNAHRWEEAMGRFQRIVAETPTSPWAAEAEMHMACYLKYNARYDEAEEKFLSILEKYPGDMRIRKKVLRYLPDVYARTGRFRTALGLLREFGECNPDWQERQFVENWSRLIHAAAVEADGERRCGVKALALALMARDQARSNEGIENVALESMYGRYAWARRDSAHPDGYSLHDLQTLSGGRVVTLSMAELSSLAAASQHVLVYLQPPRLPKLGGRSGRSVLMNDNLNSGHFVVVESVDKATVVVLDPAGGRSIWPRRDFLYRWAGLTLLLPSQGKGLGIPVARGVAKDLRGGCCGSPPPDPDGGACSAANAGGGRNSGPMTVSGPGGHGPEGCPTCRDGSLLWNSSGAANAGIGGRTAGAPGYSFGLPFANLVVMDTPMWYPSAKGPGLRIDLVYNRVNTQNMASNGVVNYYSFGNKWSCGLMSYVKGTPAGDVQVVIDGGQLLQYTPLTNGAYRALDVRNDSDLSISGSYYALTFDGGGITYFFPTNPVATNAQQIAKMRDRYGNELSCWHDPEGMLTNVTDALGRFLSFQYGEAGFVTNITDSLGRRAIFSYSADGNLMAITDMGGYSTALAYDTNNWITNILYPSGSDLAFNFKSGLQMGAPYSNSAYANQTNPAFCITAVNALGFTNEYWYHAFNQMGPMSVKDEAGNSWLYAHDRVYGGFRDDARSECIYVDAVNDRPTAGEYRNADQWEHRRYDLSGNPIEAAIATNPFQTSIGAGLGGGDFDHGAFTTNHFTRLYVYDTNHWALMERWRTNGVLYASWSNAYDSRGNLLKRRDPLGQEVSYGYDLNDNVVAITNPLGQVTRMSYDANGNLTNLTDALGYNTAWMFNTSGLNTAVILPGGQTNAMSYDSIGRLQSSADAAGWTTTLEYDDLDRVVRANYGDGTHADSEYSCCGLEAVVDRLGRRTSYTRDALGRITAIENAAGHGVGFAHDPLGNITNLSIPVGLETHTTAFEYTPTNGFSRLTRRVSPLGKTQSYTYTFRGQVASRTDGLGQTTAYGYDALGRLTGISYGAGTNVVLSYDVLGRTVGMSDWCSTNAVAYDRAGRITNKASRFSIPGFAPVEWVAIYAYDPVGNVTSRTIRGVSGFTNVLQSVMTYDAGGQLLSLQDDAAAVSYGYDAAGRLATKTYGNGDFAVYRYDVESRVIEALASNGTSVVQGWTYAYDAMGMVTNMSGDGNEWSYAYDAIYQLTQEVFNATNTLRWRYDEAGNRVEEAAGGTVERYLYNGDNELVWLSSGTDDWITVSGRVDPGPRSNKWFDSVARAGGRIAPVDTDDGSFEIAEVPVVQGSNDLVVRVTDVSGNTATQIAGFVKGYLGAAKSFDHDANGNLVAEAIAESGAVSTNEYVWDRENRLAKVLHNGAVVEECWYDGMGRRLAKREVVNGQTNEVQYLWDGWSVVAVLDGQGGLLEFYTRGLGIAGDIGTIVAETRFSAGSPTNTYYYHCNHRGDITTVRSGTNTVAEYDYAPFGEVRSYSGSYSARFRFSTKEYDQASGLCYFGYRFYSPTVARWLSCDPIVSPGFVLIAGAGSAENDNEFAFEAPSPDTADLFISVYRYCLNSPANLVDTVGLWPWTHKPQKPGCDGVPDGFETPCVRRCCDKHDKCYEQNFCTACSWAVPIPPSCAGCNARAVACIAKCARVTWGPVNCDPRMDPFCGSGM